MWLAGVPIPTRPDWWLVQPTGRRHTVPPGIKRALAQAAIEYVVRLDATSRDRRSPGRAKCWRGRAGGRRPLRYAATQCSEDAGSEGMGGAGRTIGECVENPVLRAPSVFALSSPAAKLRATILNVADFLAQQVHLEVTSQTCKRP